MKIQNPFRLGLLAGLGVLAALLIGGALTNLATILTYVGVALFLALGLDPLVSWLERHKVKRPLAILITLVAVLGVFAGLIFALIPVIVDQVQNITTTVTAILPTLQKSATTEEFITNIAPWLDPNVAKFIVNQVTDFFSNPDNIAAISNGVLQAGVNTASGLFGALIVIILMIYFVASLGSMKRGLYVLVPASKRPKFIDIAEQISQAVGRYVMGQVSLALVNGILSLILLSSLGVKYGALLAFIAFLGSLIPLVGTITASIIIMLSTFLFTDLGSDTYWHTIVVVAYYLVYMQFESYFLNPRIMNRAVKVPGVIVVIAALAGGTLLGVLGALVAIPVAASVLLIVQQVVIPRQNEL